MISTRNTKTISTLSEAFEAIVSSPEFHRLAPSTKESYVYLRPIVAKPLRIDALNHVTIEKILMAAKHKPGLYRRARALILRLAAYAQTVSGQSFLIRHSITCKNLGQIQRWSPEQVTYAIANSSGDIRLAIALIYHTAQRLVDVVALRGVDIEIIDGRKHFRIRQQKTGHEVLPLITPTLEALLPDMRGRFIASTPQSVRERWRIHAVRIGLAGLTLHGLRKAASCEAAEGGASMPELQAFLGHRSIQTAALYFEGANKARLAASAASRRSLR